MKEITKEELKARREEYIKEAEEVINMLPDELDPHVEAAILEKVLSPFCYWLERGW